MTIKISALKKRDHIEKVIIHSLDLCLYQASAIIDDKEEFITDDKGKLLRSHSVLSFQAMFEKYPIKNLVVRHTSAYDEMVGQPVREGSNAIEVPFGRNQLGNPKGVTSTEH
ncbi:MAG: DUF6482 family protein [Saccharospirillaceae bacterium]|nr:DUF6482 family protein [Saccharospirillaceae bacterium]